MFHLLLHILPHYSQRCDNTCQHQQSIIYATATIKGLQDLGYTGVSLEFLFIHFMIICRYFLIVISQRLKRFSFYSFLVILLRDLTRLTRWIWSVGSGTRDYLLRSFTSSFEAIAVTGNWTISTWKSPHNSDLHLRSFSSNHVSSRLISSLL